MKKKFDVGYPKDNIIFQSPERAIIYQDGKHILDEDITKPNILVDVLKEFFDYQPPAFEQWEEAISDFKEKVSDLGEGLKELIEKGRQVNKSFITAFNDFMTLCRQSINPNLSEYAVEEMLIQHLLTERLFRKVFNNPDFS
ncbi:MAG TPA: DNA helicase, partial [Spirochaetes bacterium]|nr:DNA helicase [Spirochaetota bacterium]